MEISKLIHKTVIKILSLEPEKKMPLDADSSYYIFKY